MTSPQEETVDRHHRPLVSQGQTCALAPRTQQAGKMPACAMCPPSTPRPFSSCLTTAQAGLSLLPTPGLLGEAILLAPVTLPAAGRGTELWGARAGLLGGDALAQPGDLGGR